jgi:beta-galactosidase
VGDDHRVFRQNALAGPPAYAPRRRLRWAELSDADGNDPRVTALAGPFLFTARRWTSQHLDATDHTTDLVPSGTVWVNLDHAQQGRGSEPWDSGPLPQYHLTVAPAEFQLAFTALDRL